MERQSLKDKVAVITGGSRGIGFAVAQALGAEGCNVVITGRDSNSLRVAVAKIKRYNGTVLGHACDVSSPPQVQKLFAAVSKHHSRIDILVNNAGVAHPLAPVENLL